MKLNILITFVDCKTGKRHEAGTVAEFTEERAQEILADFRHLAEQEEPTEEPGEPAEEPAAPEDPKEEPKEEKPKKKRKR